MRYKQIWKFEIPQLKEFTEDTPHVRGYPQTFSFKFPGYGYAASLGLQRGSLCLWLEVHPGEEEQESWFHLYGTGYDIPSNLSYLHTLITDDMVLHLYRGEAHYA